MKPTAEQTAVLSKIERGLPVTPSQLGMGILTVAAYQWSRDGDTIVAHRTVLRDAPTGSPRTDYRTELYRVRRDGSVSKL